MIRRLSLKIAAPLAMLLFAQGAAAATLVVTKNALCHCCNQWVALMQQAGFTVEVHAMDVIAPLSDRLGVPERLRSCHVAEIGGYVIEGHVPAADIARLLRKHPAAVGLAVPGMVEGSPGMDNGGPAQHFNTIIFFRDGRSKVFAAH